MLYKLNKYIVRPVYHIGIALYKFIYINDKINDFTFALQI